MWSWTVSTQHLYTAAPYMPEQLHTESNSERSQHLSSTLKLTPSIYLQAHDQAIPTHAVCKAWRRICIPSIMCAVSLRQNGFQTIEHEALGKDWTRDSKLPVHKAKGMTITYNISKLVSILLFMCLQQVLQWWIPQDTWYCYQCHGKGSGAQW